MAESKVPVVPQPAPPIGIWRRSAVLYLLTFCAMTLLGALALVLVFITRPHSDNTGIITTVLGFVGAGIPALMALIKSAENAESIREIHVSINSRMDEFLRQASILGQAQGRELERTSQMVPPMREGGI